MAKDKVSSNKENMVAKAGKRSGGYHEPPAAKPDNRAGREGGEQQFYATRQLTVEKEISTIVYDKALQAFVNRTRTITLPVNEQFQSCSGLGKQGFPPPGCALTSSPRTGRHEES